MFNAEKLIAEIHGALDHHLFWMLQSRYIGGADITPFIHADDSPISEIVISLVSIANGSVPRASADTGTIAEAREGVQQLCEVLFAPAFGGSAYTIPDSFWETELGRLIVTVQAWAENRTLDEVLASHQEMLSPQEAADLKGANEKIIRNILNDDAQREQFFPGARLVGEGRAGRWQIPLSDVEAWTPRKRGRQPKNGQQS